MFGSYLDEVLPDIEAREEVFPTDCLDGVAPDFSVPASPSLMVESLLSELVESISLNFEYKK